MKMKIPGWIATVFILCQMTPGAAQDYFSTRSVNFNKSQIIFANPAGLALQDHRQALFSSQLLYSGLANDRLYNHYLGYVEPLGSIGTIGLRAKLFNSTLLAQNTFSLLFSRVVSDALSLGVNLNLHHYGYDKDKFKLRELNDPLLANNTAANGYGFGLGAIYNPLDELYLGLSLDDINRPDISLEGGKARRPLVTALGLFYRFGNFLPQLDFYQVQDANRSESYYSFSLDQMFFDNSANLSLQYQRDRLTVGAGYCFGSFWLDYQYAYPLNDLNEISSGSHQFSLSYHFGALPGYASAPKILLLSPQTVRTDSNSVQIQAQVSDKRGLQRVTVQLNDLTVSDFHYHQKDQQVVIDVPVTPLAAGDNKITILARNDAKHTHKDILVNYSAPMTQSITVSTPKIEITTPFDAETNSSAVRLNVSVEFVLELKDLKVKINGKEVQLRGPQVMTADSDKMQIEAEVDLEEGMNDIEFIAFNARGTSSQKKSIRYNPITESLYEQLWAVVIGIDKYQSKSVENLSYAVKDAKGIEKVLKEKYKFQRVITLYDEAATRSNILRAISTDLKLAKENDGIFIFFAGHGITGEGIAGGPLGYLVPTDGTFDESEFYVKNIPMSLIKEIAQTIKSKHIYYVMDCCYGGLLLRAGKPPQAPETAANYNFLKSLAKWPVRQVLTAGGQGQRVLDGGFQGHSVFTGRLIQGLDGEADSNQDGFITAEELNFFVRQHVHGDVSDIVRGHPMLKDVEQMPQYGKWYGEGEFIFKKK